MTSRHEDGSWRARPAYEKETLSPYREFALVIVPDDCDAEEFWSKVIGVNLPEEVEYDPEFKKWDYIQKYGLEKNQPAEEFFEFTREIEGVGIYEVDVLRNSYFAINTALLTAKGKAFDDRWSLPCNRLFIEIVDGKIEGGL